jgi:enoyl-CoA hydratase/carnithine racemase
MSWPCARRSIRKLVREQAVLRAWRLARKVSVAAVSGFALGAAWNWQWPVPCFASDNAKLGQPEVSSSSRSTVDAAPAAARQAERAGECCFPAIPFRGRSAPIRLVNAVVSTSCGIQ